MKKESQPQREVMAGLGKSIGSPFFESIHCAKCTWQLVALYRPQLLTTLFLTRVINRCFGIQRIIRRFANHAMTGTSSGLKSRAFWLGAMKVGCRLIPAIIGTSSRQGGRVQSLRPLGCRPIPNLYLHNREMNRGYPLRNWRRIWQVDHPSHPH